MNDMTAIKNAAGTVQPAFPLARASPVVKTLTAMVAAAVLAQQREYPRAVVAAGH